MGPVKKQKIASSRLFAIPGVHNKDVERIILYRYLVKRDRQMLRCAWFPSMEASTRNDPSLAGYYAGKGDVCMMKWVFGGVSSMNDALKWAWECAATKGHVHVFEHLSFSVKHNNPSNLKHYAILGNHPKALDWLFVHFGGNILSWVAIEKAVSNDYLDILKCIVRHCGQYFRPLEWDRLYKASRKHSVTRKWIKETRC